MILLLTLSFLMQAELKNISPASSLLFGLPIRNVGPSTRGLRVSSMAVYENDSKIFYLGSGDGGVFKTIDGGKTFDFVFDKQGSANIGAIALSQNTPQIVWVGTGEGWQRNSVGRGDGIYKSIDAGKTWKHMGLQASNSFSKIVIDHKNDNIVFSAVLGSPWGYGSERGIYRTVDGGKNWKKVLYVNEKTAGADVIIDPKNSKNLLAAMWDHIHRPYGWFETGPGSGIYKSTDGGDTWRKIMKGLPKVNVGRIALDYFRKDPRHVVAAIEEPKPGSSFYRSMDGGESWVMMPATHYQDGKITEDNPWYRPFYNQLVCFHPNDVNTIYHGNRGHYTKDGGKTFVGSTDDDHAFWVDPYSPQHYISAGDCDVSQGWNLSGGSYDSTSVRVNLPVIDQVYGVGYDMRKLYWVMGNMQDNQAWTIPTQTKTGYVSELDTESIKGGEGGKSIADPNDWTTVYAQHTGMRMDRLDLRTGRVKNLFRDYLLLTNSDESLPTYATDNEYEAYKNMNPRIRAGWNAAFQISPWNSHTLYFGANFLYKSIDRGDHWQIISPDLTHDNLEWQKPDGVVYRNNENGTCRTYQTIRTVCESALKQGMIWVGTDDGYVQLTMDGGKTWENLTKNIPGIPEYCWVSHIYASRFSEKRAYVTFDNHRNFDNKTYVFATEDYGKTWTKLNGNLPQEECCFVIKEGLKNPDLLLLGTEFSLWISLDRGKTWGRYQDYSYYGNGGREEKGYFPTVAVHDLEIHPRELDLIIGTHGRGIWIMPIRALEEMTPANLAKDVYFTSPGNVYLFPQVEKNFRPTVFRTDNTQPGTLFSYYLRENAKGGATIKITNANGTEIYSKPLNLYSKPQLAEIRGPAMAGINSVRWMAREFFQKPGDYRVVLTINGKEYYQTLHVEDATDEVLSPAYHAMYPKKPIMAQQDRD